MNNHAEEVVVANLQEQSRHWSLLREAPTSGMCAWHADFRVHSPRVVVVPQVARPNNSLPRRGSACVRDRTPLTKAITTPECSFPQPAPSKHSMRLITKYGVKVTTFDKYLAGTLRMKQTQKRGSSRETPSSKFAQYLRWKPLRLSRALEKQLFPDIVNSLEIPWTRQKNFVIMSEPKLAVKFSPISKQSPPKAQDPLTVTKEVAPAWSFGPSRDDGHLVSASSWLHRVSSRKLRPSASTAHCLALQARQLTVPASLESHEELPQQESESTSEFLQKLQAHLESAKTEEDTQDCKPPETQGAGNRKTLKTRGTVARQKPLNFSGSLNKRSVAKHDTLETKVRTPLLKFKDPVAMQLGKVAASSTAHDSMKQKNASDTNLVSRLETVSQSELIKEGKAQEISPQKSPRLKRKPYKGIKHAKTYVPGPGHYSPMLRTSSSGYSFQKSSRFATSPQKGFFSPGPAMYSPSVRVPPN